MSPSISRLLPHLSFSSAIRSSVMRAIGKRGVRIFQRIGHAPDPVVHLDDLVFALDDLAIDFLRRPEVVIDDLNT